MFAVKATQLTISITKLGNIHISFQYQPAVRLHAKHCSILQVTYSRFLSLGDYIYIYIFPMHSTLTCRRANINFRSELHVHVMIRFVHQTYFLLLCEIYSRFYQPRHQILTPHSGLSNLMLVPSDESITLSLLLQN